MKLLLISFTFFMTFSVNAQGLSPVQKPERPDREKEISGMIKFATERLELSKEEAVVFEQIMRKHFDANKKIEEKYLDVHLAEAAERDSLENNLQNELKEILSPEKQKQFERIMRRAMHSPPGPPPGQNGMKPKK